MDQNEKFGDAFRKGGPFFENIRISTGGDDNELRESLKVYGWVEELPALSDEHDVILVGHRRLKIAKELGINPIIKKLVIGDGDEGNAKRLRLAIASNTGHKPMSKEDRQRIAEYLYGKPEWTMQLIADALNVSVGTIHGDLGNFSSVEKLKPAKTKANPKGAGRPKGKKKPPRKASKRHPRADEVMSLADQDLTDPEISNQTGISPRMVREIIDEEMKFREGKAAGKAEAPEIDLTLLSMSVQQKCEAWKRQTEKRLRVEIAEEERKKIRKEWDEIHLPHYKERLAHAEAVEKAWRGVFTGADYRRLLAALHPDRNSGSDAHDLFILFKSKERILLSRDERPAVSSWIPTTVEEMMKRKAEVSAARKAQRAANKAAREGAPQS